ncbi:hypothetical protein [Pontibacter actiniarum]|nr:hypothetical protein [Pontibacter actiniarum]
MKSISAISSMLLVGTTVGLFIKSWLAPSTIEIDLTGEEYHLYL